MIVNGIIAEYNPFHNGHQYHLERSRRETGADYNVVVLSSNFTQRGEPAIIDKFTRAKMALECGADLVIELPVSHSAASAEFFAQGGVSLLHQLGVVDYLCFGSECGDIKLLQTFAKILLEEPKAYLEDLKSCLAAGHSYPVARNRALMDYAPELAKHKDILSSPNNILGIEYIKALMKLESPIKPFTIFRAGAGYHDRFFETEYCSALAIREALLSKRNAAGEAPASLLSLSAQMPKKAFRILSDVLSETPPITVSDFSEMLLYKLLMEQEAGYDRYVDVSSDLSDHVRKNLKKYQGYAQFCDLLKTKNMTYTRISRSLLNILLGATEPPAMPLYARVLGFRKDASPLLTEIKKRSSIPLISKLADAGDILTPEAYDVLRENLRRESVYESVAALKAGRTARDEREIPIITI